MEQEKEISKRDGRCPEFKCGEMKVYLPMRGACRARVISVRHDREQKKALNRS